MQLNRRRLLAGAGLLLAGASGLIAACQSGASQPTIVVTSAPAAAPTVAPTAAPTAVPTAVVVAPTPAAAPRPTPLPVVVAGKPMYQQDPQHTGRSAIPGPRQPPRLLRRFDSALPQNLPADPVTPRADFQSSSAIGPDGTIYIANFPGALFALRDSSSAADQLDVVWRFHPPTAGSFHATPALSADGSTLYIGFSAGGFNQPGKATFYALKTAPNGTGAEPQVLWTVDLGATRVMASPTVGSDGTIYVGNSGGDLFAIALNGTLKWQTQTGPSIKSAPALAVDGTVYHASSNGKMYALSLEGQLKWTFDFGEHLGPTPLLTSQGGGPGGGGGANGVGSGASPSVGADGTIFIGANNSNMYAVAPDGRLKWLFEAERELAGIWTTPALSADGGTIYFGANKGGVYAVNADSGTQRWQFPVYGSIYASSVLDARGVLYTGTTIEHVYAVDSATGEQIWDYDAHNEVWSAPSIRPDGSLVIADRAGLVQLLV